MLLYGMNYMKIQNINMNEETTAFENKRSGFFCFLFSFFCFFCFNGIQAQVKNDTTSIMVEATIVNGDTIPIMTTPIVSIKAEKVFANEKEKMKYTKLVNDVKIAYAYAKIAGVIILRYNDTISRITDKKTRKEYLEKAEESLKARFKDDILKMSFTQGHILIKLIYRETGNSSYEVIKQLRGGFQAFLWQSVARLFGNNLKDNYNKETDKAIEEIVLAIDAGNI